MCILEGNEPALTLHLPFPEGTGLDQIARVVLLDASSSMERQKSKQKSESYGFHLLLHVDVGAIVQDLLARLGIDSHRNRVA